MKKVLYLILIQFLYAATYGQAHRIEKLKVFIDCSNTFCDQNYMRSEIKVVDFLRDRIAADVHVLITSQRAGAGGRKYQLIFYGQNVFENYVDTLEFTTGATATDDEKRKQVLRYLMLGLSPLIAKTSFAGDVSISMNTGRDSGKLGTSTTDKWNFWFFRINLDGNFNYDKVYKSSRINTRLSADRITDKLKLEFDIYRSNEKSVYDYQDSSGTTKFEVKNSSYGFYNNVVKTLSPHWSYGFQFRYSNNTFSNYKHKIYFNPAIEYNIFNYRDVNNKFFVIRYGLDVTNNRYYDTTLFNEIRQTLYGQSFSAAITLNQKWGTFNSGLYYHNYFNDFKLNHLSLRINLDARITGALSFNVYIAGSIVHDQVNLAKGDASPEDVLSRRRQLGSAYNLNTSFGLTYRFGSKFNNVVNPRFDGYGGF
ncbi:MAG: hypothetical protein M3Z92_02725 [Bacteroidota bacterium]|nr:hypothetical protein [Bacteroidota bacterium]